MVRKRFALALLCALSTLGHDPARANSGGAGVLGTYDASVVDLGGPYVLKAQSTVDVSTYPSVNQWLVSTNLYLSTNSGGQWINLGVLNVGRDLSPSVSERHEVPSVVLDPSDIATSRLKVVWDHYFTNSGVRDNSMAWIGVKGAPAGAYGPSAFGQEIKLLAGNAYNPDNSVDPGKAIFPLPSSLSDCITLSEPGAMGTSDGFYLSFNCFGSVLGNRIALVKFSHANGATALETHGTLLSQTDAQLFAQYYGSSDSELKQTSYFSGSDLVYSHGAVYLIATPATANGGYLGCAVFQVTDINNASILRNPNGAPRMVNYISGTPGTFRGACTYSDTTFFVQMDQLNIGAAQPFSVINSQHQLLN